MINIENTRLLLNKWAEYELISSSGYHPQSPVATLIQPRGTGAGSEPASIKASADVFNVVRILDDLRRQGFDDYVNVIRVWYLRLPNQQLATVAHSAGISVDAFKRLKVRAEEAVMHRLGACRYSG